MAPSGADPGDPGGAARHAPPAGRTLITGATGFIGSALASRLASDGWDVRALVRPGTDAGRLEDLGIEVVRGDLRDAPSVDRAMDGVRRVFHLAARTSHAGISEREMIETNVVGTETVVARARTARVDRFVHCSTARVYGIVRNHAVDEETAIHPESPYPASKARAEEVVREHGTRGLRFVIARVTAAFGPGSKSWLPLFRSIADGSFRMIGRGDNWHHTVDLEDLVAGLVLCGTVPGVDGRSYIVSGSEPVRLRDMIAMIADELGAPPAKPPLPGWPLSVYKRLQDVAGRFGGGRLPRFDRVEFFLKDRTYDIARARHELGFEPRIGVQDSIRRTVDSYRSLGLLPAREASAST